MTTWTNIAKSRAKESYWNPIKEQAGIIANSIGSGEIDINDFFTSPLAHVDRSIIGNRISNEIYEKALKKVLREDYGYSDEPINVEDIFNNHNETYKQIEDEKYNNLLTEYKELKHEHDLLSRFIKSEMLGTLGSVKKAERYVELSIKAMA